MHAFRLIAHGIFSPQAASGGLLGIGALQVLRTRYLSRYFYNQIRVGDIIFPHSMADVQRFSDQGILAMFSAGVDALLSLLSGLVVLVTGIWMQGEFRSTLVYEAFKLHMPCIGRIIFTGCIALFALTTVIGNSFNGRQSFASLTNFRWINAYIMFTVGIIFLGSLMHAQLAWEMMDTLLFFVAIPNLIGVGTWPIPSQMY